MDFELSEELVAVRDLAREFAEKEIAPTAATDDKEKNFRADLVKKMGELGFYGTMIPENYGGTGLGFLAMVLITEEIARAHSAMRVAINMQVGPAVTLLQFGTEEQKQNFIPPLVSGEKIGCFAITEADAGSDVAGMRTTATKQGEKYLLNGSKLWISNAPVTNGGLIYAYTDRSQKHRGMSAFYADWDQPGLTRRPLETMGANCSPLGELMFDNFAIPAANRLGNEGDGFKTATNACSSVKKSASFK
jgi:glutaryl-CoA dehydrogenase (non-decarboxylating)